MKKKLALIHTVGWYAKAVLEPFANAWLQQNPDVEAFNIADDSLLTESLEHQGATAAVLRRILAYVTAAEYGGADVVMVTCTTVGEASRIARRLTATPVFNIDEPMAREAVQVGRRLGVVATVPTSAPATRRLLEEEARQAGKQIQIETVINEEAFAHLVKDEVARHDEIVQGEIDRLAKRVDAVVLGQISLARMVAKADVPVLQVGHSGFREARRLLDQVRR